MWCVCPAIFFKQIDIDGMFLGETHLGFVCVIYVLLYVSGLARLSKNLDGGVCIIITFQVRRDCDYVVRDGFLGSFVVFAAALWLLGAKADACRQACTPVLRRLADAEHLGHTVVGSNDFYLDRLLGSARS